MQHVNEVFPCHIDGALLEIVSKRPVAKHLEHGVVICVVTNFLQVVMLSAHAQALLRVRSATWLWFTCAKDNILPLVHTCVSEHQRWVVLNNHRSRRNDCMTFRLEEFLE